MEKSQEVNLGDLVIHPYHPPNWLVGKVKFIPSHRLHLGNFPTPIQPWRFEGMPVFLPSLFAYV
jgi:hypothetical protein